MVGVWVSSNLIFCEGCRNGDEFGCFALVCVTEDFCGVRLDGFVVVMEHIQHGTGLEAENELVGGSADRCCERVVEVVLKCGEDVDPLDVRVVEAVVTDRDFDGLVFAFGDSVCLQVVRRRKEKVDV